MTPQKKPLRTLRYDGVLTSHTNGVLPLLIDKANVTWQTGFDAEAYVEKLVSQIPSEIVSDRILEGVVAKTAESEHDRRIL